MDASNLIIQILDTESLRSRWHEAGNSPSIQMGSLNDAAEQGIGRRVILIAPAVDISLTSASVPTTQQKRIRQAIPFALEETLAEDIENLHFAIAQQHEGDAIDVAVVRKSCMETWLTPFRERGYEPVAIVPSTLTLPYQDDTWSLIIEDHLVQLRSGKQSGISCDLDSASIVIDALLEQHDSGPNKIEVIASNADDAQILHDTLSIDTTIISATEKHLCPNVDLASVGINLLQGDYSRKEQIGRMIRPWRNAAILAAAALLLQAGISLQETSQLELRTSELKSSIEKIYRTTFPDARNVIDPKKQMEDRLARMQGSSDKGDIFLDLFHAASRSLSQQPKIQLQRVVYRDSHLDMEITTSDLQLIDQLKIQLSKEDLTVDIQSASSRDNRVEGRIRITRNAS